MGSVKVSAVIFLVALLAACGGKDKKKNTGPDTTPVVEQTPSGTTDNTPTQDTGDSSDSDPLNLKNVIYFDFDQSELSDESRTILTNNADWLKEDENRKLTIEGHTDEVGTPEYNLGLGERRARAAKEYLVRLGIDGDRVKIITYGEEKPTSVDDSLNRRSMFIATKKK